MIYNINLLSLLDAQNENLSLRKERDRALRELRDYQTKDGINIQVI